MKRIVSRLSAFASHPLARGSAVVLVGTTFANIVTYAYHLVVGRLLGPVGYGELASIFSLYYILNVPSSVLQTVLTKYVSQLRAGNEYGRIRSLTVTMFKYLSVIALAGFLAMLAVTMPLAEFLHLKSSVSVLLIYIVSAIWLLTVIPTSLLQGLQLFMPAMILTVLFAVFRLVGGAAGAVFGVAETVFANVVSALAGFLSYFIPLRFLFRIPAQPVNISKKSMLTYSVPSLLSILGITSIYSTDIMMAKHYLPPHEAGLYAALSVMGKIIFFAGSSVSYVLFPIVAERSAAKKNSDRLVYMSLAAVGGISVVITAGYALLPGLALGLLFGPSYNAAAPFLWQFGVFLSLYSMAYLVMMALLGSEKTNAATYVLVAAVVQIVGIVSFHSDIGSIILVNIMTAAGLLAALLLYYRHAGTTD